MSAEFTDIHTKSQSQDNNKLAVVTGVSGSGKDYILSELAKVDGRIGTKIKLINFGGLLFSRLRQVDPENKTVTSRDDLNRAVSQEVIKMLINSVIDEVIEQQPAVINTHVVYKQHGSLQINPDIVRRLAVNNYIYIWADPELIARWRGADQRRTREQEDLTSIELHQQVAFQSTQIIAGVLGAGFRSLYNRTDNILENVSKLQEVIEDINV